MSSASQQASVSFKTDSSYPRADYRHEHLFTLRQSLEAYRSFQKLIDDCDHEIRQQMEHFQPPHPPTDGGEGILVARESPTLREWIQGGHRGDHRLFGHQETGLRTEEQLRTLSRPDRAGVGAWPKSAGIRPTGPDVAFSSSTT